MSDNKPQRLNAILVEPNTAANASVIWLHGLGANGNDFAGIIEPLNLPATPGIRFIFPHAPSIAITANQGMTMPAWYDITSAFDNNNLKRHDDMAGIHRSAQLISLLIQHEIEKGIDTRRIILAGFSQGGAIALHTALRFPQPLGGIIALSTYLPLSDQLASERHASNQHIPILMMHGHQDNVIPLALATLARQQMEALNYAVNWHDYPMAHTVSPEQIITIGQWLITQLKTTDSATAY